MNRILKNVILFGSLALSACQASDNPRVGSETNFLVLCSSDAPCGSELSCVCGACTIACSEVSECAESAGVAVCKTRASRPLTQSCGEAEVEATCEVVCADQDDCAALGERSFCDRGLCRQSGDTCETSDFSPQDFILLGDRFLAESGEVTTQLENLFVLSATFEAAEQLRDYSSGVMPPFGEAGDLFTQYQTATAEGPAQVVILNSGGSDALLDCDTATTELCPTLQNAVNGTDTLLSEMANDGVQEVVFFFYPRPDDTTLATKFELLGAELEQVCASSIVPCHFIYLAPLFEEERDTLLTGMGLFPTSEGAEVTAGALFSSMQAACIVP